MPCIALDSIQTRDKEKKVTPCLDAKFKISKLSYTTDFFSISHYQIVGINLMIGPKRFILNYIHGVLHLDKIKKLIA